MTDIRMSQMASGIPYGDNAGRPSNPGIGRLYSNGEASRLELYTSNGWQNITQETPSVVAISGIAKESVSSTITVNGTNFAVGCNVLVVGTNGVEVSSQSTNLVSVVQLTATLPALNPAHEPYDIKVLNPSNLYGILYEALYVDNSPVWSTPAGSIGTFNESSSVSVSVSATDPESSTVLYSSTNLPAWLTVNQNSGLISGTSPSISIPTTYNFSISAADSNNIIPRSFSINISDTAPVWSTSSPLTSFTKSVAYSATLSATDDSGIPVSYSLATGSLPEGLSLNSSTGVISGTPTSSTPATFTIRATDNGGTYSDRQFTIPNVGPAWSTQNTFNYTQDVATTYQLSATDDSGLSITYSIISGLPSGLSVNSSTGLISGTSSIGGNGTIVARATDTNDAFTDISISYSGKSTNTWYTLSTLSFDTSEGYGGFYDNKMWFGGGVNTTEHPSTLYYVDTITGLVTLKNSSAILRDEVGSAWGNNGKLYVFYGAVNNSGQNRNTWEYDPVANTFTQKADAPGADSYRSDVGAYSTFLYHLNDSNQFYRYDPSTNTHTSLASASGPNFPGGFAYKLGLDGTTFYCVSGQVFGSYSITGNTWTTLSAPPVSVSTYTGGSGSHTQSPGKFFIFAFNDPAAKAYRYNSETNNWTDLGSTTLLQTRNSFTDFDKTNGIAYVVGGTITGGYLRDVKYAILR